MANEFNNFQLSFEVPRTIQDLILTHTLLDNVIARSFLTLTPKSLNEIPWGYHSNETSRALVFHSTVHFLQKDLGEF